MSRIVHVQAPSRLHFGMLSFGHASGRQYGGVGAMVGQPALKLRLSKSDRLLVTGPLARRAREFALRWVRSRRLASGLTCSIEVNTAPRAHVGLGVGTQLALSIAAGLNALFDYPEAPPQELARSVTRGARSAVGTYGFVHGGLIVERGKLPSESISPLDCRVELPDDWRFVMICPRAMEGLFGETEKRAFSQLPPVPPQITDQLQYEVHERMLPAASERKFDDFAESVYRFGRLAGQCFAAIQGGPYNGDRLTKLVQWLRASGVRGVGQSSWGPTLYALQAGQTAAEILADQLTRHTLLLDAEVWISAPNNHGAEIQFER